MDLKVPFVTSIGSVSERNFMIVEAIDESDTIGFGECVAFETPWYTPETQDTCLKALHQLIPEILGVEIHHPDEVFELFSFLDGNHMAKASIDGAIWEIYAKLNGVTLREALGGDSCRDIFVGISIGLQKNDTDLFTAISDAVAVGYKRIKLKVEIDKDYETLEKVRDWFPDIPLMIDANGAYSVNDMDRIRRLDKFNLMMIEQPFNMDEWASHIELQSSINTPICLDESIDSFEACVKAVKSAACKIITIKAGRVGGLSQAKKIHGYCYERGIPVWCGGMLESAIGRLQNIALASLPGFTIAGDISASSRYWEKDVISPGVTVVDGKVVFTTFDVCDFEKFKIRDSVVFVK